MSGVKFADEAHRHSLEETGYCAFIVSKEDRECFHPEIGEVISLIFKNQSRNVRLRCNVRLIADQELKNGGCISIYASALRMYEEKF